MAMYREGQNPMFEGPHVLRLDETGLVAITPKAEARIALTSVQRIVDTPGTFLSMSARSRRSSFPAAA